MLMVKVIFYLTPIIPGGYFFRILRQKYAYGLDAHAKKERAETKYNINLKRLCVFFK